MTKTINAAENPALANQLAAEATKPSKTQEKAEIVFPSELVVTLPGGFVTLAGEVITEAEVRELNGKDEEAISRSNTPGKVLTTILSRGVARLGDMEATEDVLDQLLAGDRDYLLLSIYRATFGDEADIDAYCNGCEDYKTLTVDVEEDVEVEPLEDPINGRRFDVKTKKHTYTCVLPTGKTQKELLTGENKTIAELTTILLAGTVRAIDGKAVLGRNQIQEIGVADRRAIADELSKKTFGPVINEVSAECPDCGGEVVAPINLGTLFRF